MSARTLAARGRNRSPGGLVTRGAARAPLRRLGVALTVLWALGSGCATQQHPSPATALSGSKEHSELKALEKSIADNKASLHNSGDDRLATSATADSAPTPMSGGPAPAPRCDGVCRAGQEICTASRRICKIATQLNESAVTTSCQRAERACGDASALCAQCR